MYIGYENYNRSYRESNVLDSSTFEHMNEQCIATWQGNFMVHVKPT